MDDTVANRRDLGHICDASGLGIGKIFDNGANRYGVVGHIDGDLLDGNVLGRNLMGIQAVGTDTLAKTLCDHFGGFHIKKLILQGRTPRIYYKYEHNFFSP
jgi:hypothetical protein